MTESGDSGWWVVKTDYTVSGKQVEAYLTVSPSGFTGQLQGAARYPSRMTAAMAIYACQRDWKADNGPMRWNMRAVRLRTKGAK